MASSLVKVDIHLMFHVKSTGVTMRATDLPRIFAYVGGIVKGLGSIPLMVGGMPDHLHILASLPPTKTLAEFVRTVKAESSKWMKTLDPSYARFAWQDGYGAFSVSASVLEKTQKYIRTSLSITRGVRSRTNTARCWRNTECSMMSAMHSRIDSVAGSRLQRFYRHTGDSASLHPVCGLAAASRLKANREAAAVSECCLCEGILSTNLHKSIQSLLRGRGICVTFRGRGV